MVTLQKDVARGLFWFLERCDGLSQGPAYCGSLPRLLPHPPAPPCCPFLLCSLGSVLPACGRNRDPRRSPADLLIDNSSVDRGCGTK